MSFVTAALIGGGVALATGFLGAGAAKSAANTQAGAANRSTDAQLQMFDTINTQQAPYRQAGQVALSSLLGGEGLPGGTDAPGVPSGFFNHQFNANDLNANLAPNYKFQLDQGLGAVKNAGNLQTGLLSGNTLKGINDYAQNYAGSAYQNAFQNYTANQTNIFNRLSNIAGLGQTANQTTAQAGTTAAQNAGNSIMAGGAAQAAGTIGQANAITGAANNALGWYSLSQIMNKGGNV